VVSATSANEATALFQDRDDVTRLNGRRSASLCERSLFVEYIGNVSGERILGVGFDYPLRMDGICVS
jgi:hypothetical protein